MNDKSYKKLSAAKIVSLVVLAFLVTIAVATIVGVAFRELNSFPALLLFFCLPIVGALIATRASLKRDYKPSDVHRGMWLGALLGSAIPVGIAAWFLITFITTN